jgi:hypothetical protein
MVDESVLVRRRWNPRLKKALSFGAECGPIRFKPVSVSQFQKSPCQLVSIIPKVKKCKKSVQNMLKTCWFMLIFVQNARVFVNFLSVFARFYPHFSLKNA